MEIKLEDLDLYVNDNDVIKGYDKDKNVYVLYKDGSLKLLPGKKIDDMWGGCSLSYAKQVQQKLLAAQN